jgi:3-oxoacyl-[acyl-carrier-protein] synthase-3
LAAGLVQNAIVAAIHRARQLRLIRQEIHVTQPTPTPLSIVGLGLHLPPTVPVKEFAEAHGGDVTNYRGWERACHAGPDEHPSDMGAKALGQAIERSGVAPADIRMVIYTGASRDYLPSWSVSNEVMRLCGLSAGCLGLDLAAGCLATLAALDLLQGWLGAHGGGYAAVVASERWTQTLNFKDTKTLGLWQYGDSAGALLVKLGQDKSAIADYLGAEFRSAADMNGHVLIRYGGTREPQAPPGVDPNSRRVSDRPKETITGTYRKGYGEAYALLKQRFPLEPARLLVNQMSPQIVGMLAETLGMTDRVLVTGNRTGHLGGTDIIAGLQTVVDEGGVKKPLLVGASTAYGFGTGFLVPPEAALT